MEITVVRDFTPAATDRPASEHEALQVLKLNDGRLFGLSLIPDEVFSDDQVQDDAMVFKLDSEPATLIDFLGDDGWTDVVIEGPVANRDEALRLLEDVLVA